MKQILIFLIAMLLVPAAWPQAPPGQSQPAPAADSGWTRVEYLARSDALEVKKSDGHTAYCAFAGATDNALFCDNRSPFRAGEYSLDRRDVKQVRMARSPARVNKIVGVTAALGFVAGLALPETNGTPRIVGGVMGGLGGILAGCAISVPAIFVPGKLVYRQPGNTHRSVPAQSPGQ
jgi:hypothetical protein